MLPYLYGDLYRRISVTKVSLGLKSTVVIHHHRDLHEIDEVYYRLI